MLIEVPPNYKYRNYLGDGGLSLVDSSHFSTQENARTLGPLVPEAQNVWACAKINGKFFAGFHSGNWSRTDSNTDAHAEGHIVYHFLEYFDRMVTGGFIHADQPNSMSLKVTKSPCKERCSLMLVRFVADVNELLDALGQSGTFSLRIKAAYVHEGDGQDAGLSALQDLQEAMVPVVQWKIAEVFEDKSRGFVTKERQDHEFSYAKRTFNQKLDATDKRNILERQKKFPADTWSVKDAYRSLSRSALAEKKRQEDGETEQQRHQRLSAERNALNQEHSELLNELVAENNRIYQRLAVSLDTDPTIRAELIQTLNDAIPSDEDEEMDEDMQNVFDPEAIKARQAGEPIGENAPILKRTMTGRMRTQRGSKTKSNKDKPVFKQAVGTYTGHLRRNKLAKKKVAIKLLKCIANGTPIGADIVREIT